MAPQTVVSVVAVLLSLMAGSVHGFSRGAHNNQSNPMSAFSSFCTTGNFRPNHKPFMPQPTHPNYTVTVSSPSDKIYRPGQIVTVTIESVNGAKPFKGFFLRGDSTEATFGGELSCDKGQTTQFCTTSGVTHTDSTPKPKVVCRWTPPDFDIGSVQFKATIVQSFDVFWTGVKSNINLEADPNTMTYEQKAMQMREQMMRQFQSGSAADMFRGTGKARMFGGQQASMGSGRGGAGQGQANPFASLFSGRRQALGQGGDKTPFSSLVSSFTSHAAGSSSSNSEKPAGRDTGRTDLSRNMEIANLPSQFSQFFQPQGQKYRN